MLGTRGRQVALDARGARSRGHAGTRGGHSALYGDDEDRGSFARNASVCAKGMPGPVF